MKPAVRSNQLPLAECAESDADEVARRRGRHLLEVVGDALKRRGDGTWEGAAHFLDRVYGSEGRPVAASVLRASFSNGERNYPRLEWLALVLDDPEVQAYLRPPTVSPADELAELREHCATRAPDALESFDRRRRSRR